MAYSALSPTVEISCGPPEAIAGAQLVIITAGVNEKTGGATDRADPQGRLRPARSAGRPHPSPGRP